MFHGSTVAMVTPMTADGAVDDEGLARLVEFHIDNKTDAILAVGTTGESATLDHQEHCDVVARVVKLVNKRVPVMAGTGANSTAEAIQLTRCAAEAGADACLLVTPYYNKPTQEGLYRHFKAVAEAVDTPQILYNVPGRTACDMQAATVARLARIPNIIGIKEATGDLVRGREIHHLCDGAFDVYSGEDPTALGLMLEGARGVISVTANVAPRAMHDMCSAALEGDANTAREINQRLHHLHRDLFIESNPIPSKWALQEMGLIAPGIRLPLTPLAPQYHEQLRQSMKHAGI
ncbi:MAG: 4-hydroxy-tetrahydrodipicolinate synthase [Gammaproteobacteria bacterium]